MTDTSILLARFDSVVASARTADAIYRGLQDYSQDLVGFRLFTILTLDLEAELTRRAYTSDPENYPVSGTKPIEHNAWFDRLHRQRLPFVGNTIAELAAVFHDHALIASLGCGAVINLPVVIADAHVATINILHREGYYTPERVEAFRAHGSLAAKLAYLAARNVAA